MTIMEGYIRAAFAKVFHDIDCPENPSVAIDCLIAEIIHLRHVCKGADLRMRPFDEVQRAHDLLASLLLEPRFTPDTKTEIIPRADVLCWCLMHSHNERFGNDLKAVEEYMQTLGIVLEDSGHLQFPNRKPN
jgi:hypothetical protein